METNNIFIKNGMITLTEIEKTHVEKYNSMMINYKQTMKNLDNSIMIKNQHELAISNITTLITGKTLVSEQVIKLLEKEIVSLKNIRDGANLKMNNLFKQQEKEMSELNEYWTENKEHLSRKAFKDILVHLTNN